VRWLDDNAPSMGASLAYYTVFSMAPLLLIVIAVAGLVFGEEAARGEIVHQAAGLIGANNAKAIEGLVQSVSLPGQGVLAVAAGLLTTLIGATTVFAELQSALNRIWRAPGPEPVAAAGLWAWLRARLLSLGLVLALGFLLLVSLVASAALSAFARWWGSYFGDWLVMARVLEMTISFGLITIVIAVIYKWMPHVKLAWRDVFLGAVVTAVLFTLGKFAIGAYIGRSGVSSAFGAAASVVVLLLWVYYSAQIFLFGAEFTWVWAQERSVARETP